jgi:hypothetical protein
MVIGSDISVPRPWPYAIVRDEIRITSSRVSEAVYRLRMRYMVGAYIS